jgi:hypothetical protein
VGQHAQFQKSALRRNFDSCDGGYSGCNQALLTQSQQAQVDAAILARNFRNCDGHYSDCNVGGLNVEQRAVVEQSEAAPGGAGRRAVPSVPLHRIFADRQRAAGQFVAMPTTARTGLATVC